MSKFDREYTGQQDDGPLTQAKVKRMGKGALARLAHDLGLPVCRDFNKADLVGMILDRIGPDDAE